MLKGHGPSWVTLGLKNHYGSIAFKNHQRRDMHKYIYPTTADPNTNPLGDINDNPHIRDKTRLVIGDALFGHPLQNYAVPPQRWEIFGNDSPNTLFFGVDPIAIESVMLDFLNEELIRLGKAPRNHDYLHYAASLGLGIHEHWDDFSTKKYDKIDYIDINASETVVSFDPSPPLNPKSYSIDQNYPNPFNSQTTITYRIPVACRILIRVYNIHGQIVRTLLDDSREKGVHHIRWKGDNEKGEMVTSGIYYYQIIANQYIKTLRMLLMQ